MILMLHKLALIISLVSGILAMIQKKERIRTVHGITGIITLATIVIYLISTSFNHTGYVVYAILLSISFFSTKLREVKPVLFVPVHVGFFVSACAWLVYIHL